MVCLGLLDNTEVEGENEKMVIWYEEGENRSRSEGYKSSMGI